MTFSRAQKRLRVAMAAGVITVEKLREALRKSGHMRMSCIPEGEELAAFVKDLVP